MTDYLFRLDVRADKRSFTVAEVLQATCQLLHPDLLDEESPVMILSIEKVKHRSLDEVVQSSSDCDLASAPVALSDEDWQVLRIIWSRLDAPEFPMPAAQWKNYLDAFNLSRCRPKDWSLSAWQRDSELRLALKRAVALNDQQDMLKQAVRNGNIILRNPLTGRPSELVWPGDADDWLVTRAHFKAFCETLAIELVDMCHFIGSARPRCVPLELQALPDHARISYEDNIGGSRGAGIVGAGEYWAAIEATIARQGDGYFTLNEAAQVLADAGLALHPIDTKRRFLLAHSKGKLPIHEGGSRFPLEAGETIRDFLDLLKVTELDAWLRASAGYGFPAGAGAGLEVPLAASVELAPATDQGRRVKPTQALPAQEREILKVIRALGHEPNRLPPRQAGKPWVKSNVWQVIGVSQLFKSQRVFDKAWDRLRASHDIREQAGL